MNIVETKTVYIELHTSDLVFKQTKNTLGGNRVDYPATEDKLLCKLRDTYGTEFVRLQAVGRRDGIYNAFISTKIVMEREI